MSQQQQIWCVIRFVIAVALGWISWSFSSPVCSSQSVCYYLYYPGLNGLLSSDVVMPYLLPTVI